MTRLPLNLATFPFERTQRVRRTLAVATLAVVLLSTLHAAGAVLLSANNGSQAPERSEETISTAAQLREWQEEADHLVAAANPIREREIAEAVTLANALIDWRSLPWGSLFDALEAALPDGVRLELVQPTSEPDGVRVELIAASTERSGIGELIAALERQPTLSRVIPVYEERADDGRFLTRIQATFRVSERQAPGSR